MSIKSKGASTLLALSIATQATAAVCDWRPSHLFGAGGAGFVVGSSAAIGTTGAALQAAGYYTLIHAGSGLTMMGSTAAGASAAGTVGIIAGTGGALSAVAAFIMAPATITAAAVGSVGIGVLEATCYFNDERITDVIEVRKEMFLVQEHADPKFFKVFEDYILIGPGDGEMKRYDMDKLYIVNGILMHRDWFKNTKIGSLGLHIPG